VRPDCAPVWHLLAAGRIEGTSHGLAPSSLKPSCSNFADVECDNRLLEASRLLRRVILSLVIRHASASFVEHLLSNALGKRADTAPAEVGLPSASRPSMNALIVTTSA